jgi:hypothetical protein
VLMYEVGGNDVSGRGYSCCRYRNDNNVLMNDLRVSKPVEDAHKILRVQS